MVPLSHYFLLFWVGMLALKKKVVGALLLAAAAAPGQGAGPSAAVEARVSFLFSKQPGATRTPADRDARHNPSQRHHLATLNCRTTAALSPLAIAAAAPAAAARAAALAVGAAVAVPPIPTARAAVYTFVDWW